MSWPDGGDAPEGWKLRTLGDVAKVVGGGTPKTGVPGNLDERTGHPWVTPADLTGYSDKYISHGRRYITDQGLATSAARMMPAGTVLFSSRAPIGYVAIASNPVATNQGFRSLVPGDEIDSEFLYYAMQFLRPLAEYRAKGTTFAEISGSSVAELPIAYPPDKDQQRAIAAALDTARVGIRDAASHLSRARRATAKFRDAVLLAACSGRLTADWRNDHPDNQSVEDALVRARNSRRGHVRRGHEQPVDVDLPDLPDGYLIATVGDAAEVIEYGTSQGLDSTADDAVPVLRMGNIQDGRIDMTNLKFHELDREIEKLLLQDGDLLFNRTNSPELVGKSAVFHDSDAVSFASYLIRVRFHPDIADPDFVNYWINSAWGRLWAQLAKTDGVSQSNINGSKLGLMPLPLPPVDEQREIVRRASSMLQAADELLERLGRASRGVERSSQAVLAKAFRGELLSAYE